MDFKEVAQTVGLSALEAGIALTVIGGSFAAGMYRGSRHRQGIQSPFLVDPLTTYGPIGASVLLGAYFGLVDEANGSKLLRIKGTSSSDTSSGMAGCAITFVGSALGTAASIASECAGYCVGYYNLMS